MTKYQLTSLLFTDPTIYVNGQLGILQRIERESGDGRSFNLHIRVGNKIVIQFVKTTD